MDNTYSLYDLHKYVKQVFALNFEDSVWIHAEISQAKEVRGQVYIDLIEKSENTDDVIAQANAIIQFKSLLFLKKKLGKILESLLSEGVAVKIKVKLEFHERYGYKLMILDIDPAYTMGQVEMRRQEIIERLDNEGLLYINESIQMPTIVQRLAVITSETAAGYKDFIQTLKLNNYGFQYKIDLYQTSMQGKNTAHELVNSIQRINSRKEIYDAIIIIRGGGAKIDLASFDHYNIGHAIATTELPVICGIGHEIDNTVADIVAHLSLKTPTAVADYLVTRCLHFESDMQELGVHTRHLVKDRIHSHKIGLNDLGQNIKYIPVQRIQAHYHKLEHKMNNLQNFINQKIISHQHQLTNFEHIIKLSDPIHILKKGYLISKKNGKILSSAKQLKAKDKLELIYHDGDRKAIVSD